MDVMIGRASTGQRIAESGRRLVTIPIAGISIAGAVGFWTLASGLILVSGVIYHCGTMALTIMRKWHEALRLG